MKLTKETLREIIKEEIENARDVSEGPIGSVAPMSTTGQRRPRGTAPSRPVEEPDAAVGGETTMEIGAVENIKSRLDQYIAQPGNQMKGRFNGLLNFLDAYLASQGLGVKGDYRKERGTDTQRRTKSRQVVQRGKGSAAGIGLKEGESEE